MLSRNAPGSPDYRPPGQALYPAFVRYPASGGRCPVSGLNRTAMDLLVRPQERNGFVAVVKSRFLKTKGAMRSVRLVDTQSLLEYLNSLPDSQEGSKS